MELELLACTVVVTFMLLRAYEFEFYWQEKAGPALDSRQ